MTSMLVPGYDLTLGSQRWTEQLLGLEVKLALAPRVDVLRARLPARAPLEAAPGDPVELTLDSGEKSEVVFTGAIQSVSRDFREIVVAATNASGILAQYRPAVTYEKITAGTLVKNLCGDVGEEVGSLEDGVDLAFYVADPTRNAWEHIARVCGWSGAVARVTPENSVESLVVNGTEADVTLRYGRELLGFAREMREQALQSLVTAGESGAGSTSAPEALRPTTDFFAGNRPQGPDSKNVWSFEPALRTAQAASAAGAAATRAYQVRARAGRFEAFLQPDLRPGTVVQVAELPEGLDGGPFWLDGIRHRIDVTGARTTATLRQDAEGFNPASLLGSLAGALF